VRRGWGELFNEEILNFSEYYKGDEVKEDNMRTG
jgi:hypothetical protein